MNDIDRITSSIASLKLRIERLERCTCGDGVPPVTDPFGVIKQIVAMHYGVSVRQIMSSKRTEDIVWPRQIAMWLCCQATDASTNAIGEAFERDHGTVIHNRDAVADRMATDPKAKAQIEALLARVKERLGSITPAAFKPVTQKSGSNA